MFRDFLKREDKHNGGMMAEINITPFTDVVLVLLIIFMIATPIILGSGIKVKLPRAETGKIEQESFVTVTVDAAERIYFEKKPVSAEELETHVREEIGKRPGILLKLNGDRTIRYGAVVKVLEAARNAGADRYILVAERLKSGS